MSRSNSDQDQQQLQDAIQKSLQDIAVQMGEPIAPETAQQVYQQAVDLLNHIDYEPITLARVAATLLVYQLHAIELEKLDWLKLQIQAATEAEEVEELIESMSRESL